MQGREAPSCVRIGHMLQGQYKLVYTECMLLHFFVVAKTVFKRSAHDGFMAHQ